MEFIFVLPLTIGLIFGYKTLGSNDDIAHLVAIFALLNLLVSLLLAPWEIQIVLLILVAVIARLLWQSLDERISFFKSEAITNKNTGLHYRGIGYELNTSGVPLKSTEKSPKCYRGIEYDSSISSTEEVKNIPDTVIKYRGVNVQGK